MTVDDAAPHDVLDENVGRLFDRLESRGPAPGAARDRILQRLLQEASPPARRTRGGNRATRSRWVRWGGLAAVLFVAASLLTGDRDEPATPTGRERLSFAIHLVAEGPGRGVVMASSWPGGEPVHVAPERHVSSVDVEAARVARTDSGCRVDVRLTGAGTRKLARLTRDHVGERLALVIDGKVVMTPTIRSEIAQGTVALTGDFTEARCDEIARGLTLRR